MSHQQSLDGEKVEDDRERPQTMVHCRDCDRWILRSRRDEHDGHVIVNPEQWSEQQEDDVDDSDDSDENGYEPDPDEEVAEVYEVEVHYKYVMRGRVVAVNEHDAEKKLKRMRGEERDLRKEIPKPHMTHEVHSRARQVKTVTRGEVEESADVDEEEDDGVNYADRLEGWPW